jgi:hypothetical protein
VVEAGGVVKSVTDAAESTEVVIVWGRGADREKDFVSMTG